MAELFLCLFFSLSLNALASGPLTAKPSEVSTPNSNASETECKRKGGMWMGSIEGRGRMTGCNFPTKDGGKACSKGEDCESVCLKSGTCHGWRNYKGCAHFKGHEGLICLE